MSATIPVVFIHGLWVHSSAWQSWIDLYKVAGYDAIAPGWPGDSDTVAATRRNPGALSNLGLEDITDGYLRAIDKLDTNPIVIGHSFGGLVAQKLLAGGHASAAVAIDPGPIKGVKPVPFTQIRSALPVLSRPGNKKKAVSLTAKQFRYAFGNAIPQSESDQLYDRWIIPGPGRPLFEASTANFSRNSPASVDTKRNDRGPLLVIGGGADHTSPEVVAKAVYRRYAGSSAVTDYWSFPDRGHSLVFDHGWREIADVTLDWLQRQGI
jgi:non-heme chloroperoxidase